VSSRKPLNAKGHGSARHEALRLSTSLNGALGGRVTWHRFGGGGIRLARRWTSDAHESPKTGEHHGGN
jgi:hypothetical protein